MALLCLISTAGVAGNDATEQLQKKLNYIQTMQASFSQVVKAKQREISKSSGRMALSRPGKFRWHTKSPMEQLVIADGRRLWIYDVELEQVTEKKQEKGLGGTAALFLSGYDNTLTTDFDVKRKGSDNKVTFYLKAKSDRENFQKVTLTFIGNDLNGIHLFDQLGQDTFVSLRNIKTNPTLKNKLFSFKPPKDVDLITQ